MKIRNIEVPTGNICVVKGDKGLLELVSLGDYGKDHNIKADFLGLKKDINGVNCQKIMPLEEKWVVTISTQYGCDSNCIFCDVPKVGKGINATLNDLSLQVKEALKLHPEVEATKRLNIHYARMGEPTWNWNVIIHAKNLHKEVKPYVGNSMIHPVVSTMLPRKNKKLVEFLNNWCDIKNEKFRGDAGLQFSINSTDDNQRDTMFSGNALSIGNISEIGKILPDPIGRKYTLNFALSDDSIIDAEKLSKLFSINKFICKITPLHDTKACQDHLMTTTNGYDNYVPYRKTEEELKQAGFDVIVFIPSKDEDLGRITCGNVILSGSMPECKYKVIK